MQPVTRRILKVGVMAIFVVLPFAGITWVVRHQVYPSYGYHLQATIDTWPIDDESLKRWLVQQPGVAKHTVSIERNTKVLKVDFIQNRNLAGDPPIPDLVEQCRLLGYGDNLLFRDVVPR